MSSMISGPCLKWMVFVAFLGITSFARAQYDLSGFAIGDSARAWFDQQIGLEAHDLYIGVYEPLEGRSGLYHPFWGFRSWSIGDIDYRGEKFEGVYLLYDLENDLVLTRNLQSVYQAEAIRLNQEQVAWFRFGEHVFVRRQSLPQGQEAGFYELLYQGPEFEMLAQRTKERKYEITGIEINAKDFFYLIRKGEIHQIRRPSSLYKLFPLIKSELKTFARYRRIRKFGDASSETLKAFASHCAKLLSSP